MKGCGGVGVKVNGVKRVKLFLVALNGILVVGYWSEKSEGFFGCSVQD